MARFEVVVYPRELDAAELALTRLGWEVVDRFGEAPDDYGVTFRVPADEVTLELVTHEAARQLSDHVGSDAVAGLRIYVDDAEHAHSAARAAGLRLDPVSENGPSSEPWGRLVRTYSAGGLRIDFLERPAESTAETA